jgi:hypothetical protein
VSNYFTLTGIDMRGQHYPLPTVTSAADAATAVADLKQRVPNVCKIASVVSNHHGSAIAAFIALLL